MSILEASQRELGLAERSTMPAPAALSSEPDWTAPAFRPDFVRRDELVRRLKGAPDGGLALIVAPPGYGKTTLLAEWAEYDGRPFLWLELDSSEPREAIAHLSALSPWFRPDGAGSVVVIDEAHLVAPELLREAVQLLWKRLPSGSVVAVASRTEPDLPIGRLRAHRALLELRIQDLALGTGEAASLLRQTGVELEFESVQTLVRLTEGWPAALYLAALSAQQHPADVAAVSEFRGDDHMLREYLRDEVLGSLPEALMTFLLRSSVVQELQDDVCSAVLRTADTGQLLAQLAQLTGLLEPVDRAHDCYRWHPLFRQFLDAELRRSEPALRARLHKRASQWYGHAGDIDRAIDHAAAAHDAPVVGALLWEHILVYLHRGHSQLVDDWLGRFSSEAIASNPELALCAAHSALLSGDGEAAVRWAREAASRAASGDEPPRSFAAGLEVVEAMTAALGSATMTKRVLQASRSEPENSQWLAVCRWLQGVAHHLSGGDRLAAFKLLEDAGEMAGQALPIISILTLSQRAMIAIEDKRWELAEELTDEASALVAAHGIDQPIAALCWAAAAAARAHQGRADEAKYDLRAGIAALAKFGDSLAWYSAQTRLLLAHASLYLADVVGARTLLAQASRLTRRSPGGTSFERWFEEAWSYLDTVAETSLSGPSALTIAELRVLRFLPTCRPFREIADQLGVSANTVKTQAHAVYGKLGVASRSEAVARARAAGLLGQ